MPQNTLKLGISASLTNPFCRSHSVTLGDNLNLARMWQMCPFADLGGSAQGTKKEKLSSCSHYIVFFSQERVASEIST